MEGPCDADALARMTISGLADQRLSPIDCLLGLGRICRTGRGEAVGLNFGTIRRGAVGTSSPLRNG